ncbi:MAG: MarR family transcriptional regulator [Oscillatoriophycideae cyanobacterium NC_groundwater_1537_Pr4_S-0.65um_50_18]|nr:MarR family transcriptional regulator [Oscillatoriophycideae cyanobacterium NC_groundwater_1537_Pr4_S-0.65um_50_18]
MTSDSPQSPPTRSISDLLFLPETERSLINWLLRQHSATFLEIVAHLSQTPEATQRLVDDLIADGFVRAIEKKGELCYQPRLITRVGRQVPSKIWDALED